MVPGGATSHRLMTVPDDRVMGPPEPGPDARAMHQTSPARRRPSFHNRASILLPLLLLIGIAVPAPTLSASLTSNLTDSHVARVTGPSGWAFDARVDEHPADRPMLVRGSIPIWRFEARLQALAVIAAQQAAAQAEAEAAASAAAAKESAAAKAAVAAAAAASAPAYVGKNHFWVPSLGISRAVETFACTRATPPANRIYRWGCAGKNNLYLFGHAWGVMKPLHDGYVAGRVKIGMIAKYADANGRVRTYRVTEIRVVTPDQVDWAIADQSVPSMTLQTCLGATSDHRLLVRLVADH